ncbi:ThuA domain-containing protein [Rubinisphaera margarita]|uniref:ThuA domain-containing protein n=1 Tax=Rubinisphaera margarita TaxID=2909586 RepID=UPI001EE7A71F|nr:ThuA domain-containing protein [Rubinisphaera margarita]MCG6155104.1 ThuA domain-containing protein [Rubinisphaera margarita]
MRHLPYALAALCLTTLLPTAQAAEPDGAKPTKLKGLLITGGCCHDYENQKRIISEGLSQRISISWDIAHEGGDGRDHQVSIYKKENWADDYDIIVHNECFGGVTDDEFVKSIAAAHYMGKPAVFIHCALHSYRNSTGGADSWREAIGVTSRKHDKGKRSLKVVNQAADHPIMKDFPKTWDTPNGELYNIEHVWDNCTPLATAYSVQEERDMVVIWANEFGGTKMFGTSLGHHNETMNNDIWLDTVARGVLWATDHLQKNGEPEKGYEGTGEKPIVIGNPVAEPDPKFQKKN